MDLQLELKFVDPVPSAGCVEALFKGLLSMLLFFLELPFVHIVELANLL